MAITCQQLREKREVLWVRYKNNRNIRDKEIEIIKDNFASNNRSIDQMVERLDIAIRDIEEFGTDPTMAFMSAK